MPTRKADRRAGESKMTEILSISPWDDRQGGIRQSPPLTYSSALSRIAELEAALERLADSSGWSELSDKELEREVELGNGVAPILLQARAALRK